MKKLFYLLPIAIMLSACGNNTPTSTGDAISQTETTAVSDTIPIADTVEKTDTVDAYERLKEEERQMMKDILKKRKTIQ